jgi:SWI/SNF-related matrix-associated actin-dependent regulator of chromatin subfamily A3
MPTQRSSKPGPSKPNVRLYEAEAAAAAAAAADYASYAGPDSFNQNPRSSGYGTQMPVPPTLSAEALRRQQEEFARAAELRQTLANLEKVDDDGRRSSLLDNLCSTEDLLNLPEHPNPPGIASGELHVDLLRHQVCDYSLVRDSAGVQSAYVFTETSATMGG